MAYLKVPFEKIKLFLDRITMLKNLLSFSVCINRLKHIKFLIGLDQLTLDFVTFLLLNATSRKQMCVFLNIFIGV